jgi:hypothetical protein
MTILHPWEVRTAPLVPRPWTHLYALPGGSVTQYEAPYRHEDGPLLALVSWSAEDAAWIAVLWDQERRVAMADGPNITAALAALAGAVYAVGDV